MDRFKRKYVRDPETGRFVPFKDLEGLPYQARAKNVLPRGDWFDYIDTIENHEQELNR